MDSLNQKVITDQEFMNLGIYEAKFQWLAVPKRHPVSSYTLVFKHPSILSMVKNNEICVLTELKQHDKHRKAT